MDRLNTRESTLEPTAGCTAQTIAWGLQSLPVDATRRRQIGEPGRLARDPFPPCQRLLLSVNPAQQRVEQIARPGTDGAIVLPGRVLGDPEPCRIVIEAQRLHLHACLGERLDRDLLGFALAGLKIDFRSGRGLFEGCFSVPLGLSHVALEMSTGVNTVSVL